MAVNPIRHPVPPKRILVVEDDLLLAHTLQMALVPDGHQVELAQNGEQALAMLKAGGYDLVITDFMMPRMDGLELAEAVRGLFPGQPIILITAYAERLEPRAGKVSHIDVLLKKPVSVSELQAALSQIFPTP